MSKCGGLHCPGCESGGGCSVGVAVFVVVAAAVIHAVWHDVVAVGRAVVTVLEIAAYTAAAAAALAVVAGLSYGGYRLRCWYVARGPAVRLVSARAVPSRRADPPAAEAGRPALEPFRVTKWSPAGEWARDERVG